MVVAGAEGPTVETVAVEGGSMAMAGKGAEVTAVPPGAHLVEAKAGVATEEVEMTVVVRAEMMAVELVPATKAA